MTDFDTWYDELNSELLERYNIGLTDVGAEDNLWESYFANHETPDEVAEWLGEKYGLVQTGDW